MTRPTWDAVWMAHADNIGRRSRCNRADIGCNRADIGCVLVSPDNRTSTAGYVGIGGGVFVGGTAYVNAVVCFTCAKVLAAQRLARVVMRGGDLHHNPSKTITYLEAAGLQVDIYEEASDD